MAQTPPPDPQTQPAKQTTPQTKTQGDQADRQSDQADKQSEKKQSASSAPAEMKTQGMKGVLVDMSCASGSSNSATPVSSTANATEKSGKSDSANRSASDSGSSCPATANSTELGMKTDDGKILRFDLVGNQRAQEALKNNKRWGKDLSAGKPIHAKVYGVMSGEKLIVSSIQ
jgi:hypothetical protein